MKFHAFAFGSLLALSLATYSCGSDDTTGGGGGGGGGGGNTVDVTKLDPEEGVPSVFGLQQEGAFYLQLDFSTTAQANGFSVTIGDETCTATEQQCRFKVPEGSLTITTSTAINDWYSEDASLCTNGASTCEISAGMGESIYLGLDL